MTNLVFNHEHLYSNGRPKFLSSTFWLWYFFSFKGRATRLLFWLFLPFVILVGLTLRFTVVPYDEMLAVYLYVGIIIWPYISIQAKRCHDRNKSAWWVLLGYVPIIGYAWLIIELGLLSGTDGENKYGNKP